MLDPAFAVDALPANLPKTSAYEELLKPERRVAALIHDDPTSSQANEVEAGLVAGLAYVARHSMAANLDTGSGESAVEFTDNSFFESGIGIVTPHKAQKALVVRKLLGLFPNADPEVVYSAVDTVERFQGGEWCRGHRHHRGRGGIPPSVGAHQRCHLARAGEVHRPHAQDARRSFAVRPKGRRDVGGSKVISGGVLRKSFAGHARRERPNERCGSEMALDAHCVKIELSCRVRLAAHLVGLPLPGFGGLRISDRTELPSLSLFK